MDFIQKQPHFVLFPFMAQGHMIPMADFAHLLARRGVTVTILLTPLNTLKLQPIINRAVASGLTIRISLLKFPHIEAGLPEGCENYDMLQTMYDVNKFFHAASMLKEQVENLLIDLRPNCLITDVWFPWATDLALDLDVPCLLFIGMSCFSQVLWHVLETYKDMEDVASDDTDYVIIPNLPDRIKMTKTQIRGVPNKNIDGMKKIRARMRDAEMKAFGIVVNTFEELEPEYIKQYTKMKGHMVWCIGPVSLCNENELDKTERGNKASIDEQECLKWLDLQKPRSVVYVCLGSLSRVASSQLMELGLALEASNHPFIWVLRNASDDFKTWLKEENFEERVKTRSVGAGVLINGWAPQVLILSHPSVGCFLTHCGWNSTLEGIGAGLPMVTWPAFAEQFCNERFIVNVIKTGVRVGIEMPILIGEEEEVGVQVRREKIKTAIDEIIEGGDEGEKRRERARKLSQLAKRAVTDDEGGGLSYRNMTRLIQDVQQAKSTSYQKCSNVEVI